jgi:hypothetical protein
VTRYTVICQDVLDRLNATADQDVYHLVAGITPIIQHVNGTVLIPTKDWSEDPFERYMLTVLRRTGVCVEFKLDAQLNFDAIAVHQFVIDEER